MRLIVEYSLAYVIIDFFVGLLLFPVSTLLFSIPLSTNKMRFIEL